MPTNVSSNHKGSFLPHPEAAGKQRDLQGSSPQIPVQHSVSISTPVAREM